jgi:hypothetical protein
MNEIDCRTLKNRRSNHSIIVPAVLTEYMHAQTMTIEDRCRLREARQGMMVSPNQSAVNGRWSGDLATIGLACAERYCGGCAILRILPEGDSWGEATRQIEVTERWFEGRWATRKWHSVQIWYQ